MHTGGVGGGGVRWEGKKNNPTRQISNFKTLVNKNAIKPEIGILAKNIRYPLPWIFNPCASMFRKESIYKIKKQNF